MEDPKAYAAKIRKTAEVERLLRQFIRITPKTKAYDRGHVFAFEFSEEKKKQVNELMEGGCTFEEAFDLVSEEEAPARRSDAGPP